MIRACDFVHFNLPNVYSAEAPHPVTFTTREDRKMPLLRRMARRTARRTASRQAGAAPPAAESAATAEPAAPAAPAEPAYMAELEQLNQLKEQGILNEEEYAAKKAQILGI
jgi:hypothetical protein